MEANSHLRFRLLSHVMWNWENLSAHGKLKCIKYLCLFIIILRIIIIIQSTMCAFLMSLKLWKRCWKNIFGIKKVSIFRVKSSISVFMPSVIRECALTMFHIFFRKKLWSREGGKSFSKLCILYYSAVIFFSFCLLTKKEDSNLDLILIFSCNFACIKSKIVNNNNTYIIG